MKSKAASRPSHEVPSDSHGLLFGLAPELGYDLTITSTPSGDPSVEGSHTNFPSLEVWLYEDGEEPRLIYEHAAPADGLLDGLKDIHELVEIPRE